jgi:dienelactone hydrolase
MRIDVRCLLPAALVSALWSASADGGQDKPASPDAKAAAPAARPVPPTLPAERGTVKADPAARVDVAGADEKTAGYLRQFDRLAADFDWELDSAPAGAGYTIRRLRFPSPVQAPHSEVNTVLGDFYAPAAAGKYPAVIVLDIMEGRGRVSGLVAATLAANGFTCLTLQAPYRGDRRPRDRAFNRDSLFEPKLITLSTLQAATEVGRAAVWLRRRAEVDPARVGLCGVSLGGFTAGLAAGVYRSFPRTVMIIAGGDIAAVLVDGRGEKAVEQGVRRSGLSREQIAALCEPLDPLTYAARVPAGSLLMVNAEHDTVVPPPCARKLAGAVRDAQLVWLPANHHTIVLFLPETLKRTVDFLSGMPGGKN